VSDWIVTPPRQGLGGSVQVPGDKSIGHRAVLFASLCDGESQVRGLSGGEDNLRTVAALKALGVGFEQGDGHLVVRGVGTRGLRPSDRPLDCGNSGTSMRLLSGLLAAQPFDSTLVGDEYLSRRPMRRVVEPLRRMGATITGEPGAKAGEIVPPLRISGGKLHGILHESSVASAQVKSAILIAGLYAEGPTQVTEPGPSRDHTERMLRLLGAPISTPSPGVARVDPGGWDHRLAPGSFEVPSDPSSSAFMLVAALLAGTTSTGVTVRDVCVNPTRIGFLDAIEAMGGVVARKSTRESAGEPIADLVVRGEGRLRGCELGGELIVRAIDEVPILSVLATRAEGTTVIRDASELRVKESDRIATMATALRAFGVEVDEQQDGMTIHGDPRRRLRAAVVDSAGDHRIAMASAVAALCADGESRIRDVDNVATSFPGFSSLMASIGARVDTV
jgi:3-phosphoshikimate 1-carboxyvinyltransferase